MKMRGNLGRGVARLLLLLLAAGSLAWLGLAGAAAAGVAQEWVQRYNGSGSDPDAAHAIAVDGRGNVYVTGNSAGAGTYYDYVTIKYDAGGNEKWVRRYSGPGNSNDNAYAIAVDSQGSVYVTGGSRGAGTKDDYATIKYDTQGNEKWVRRYNGPGNDNDQARAIAVDSLGNVYVTGTSIGDGTDNDYATIKYDAEGNEVWLRRYNGPGNSTDGAHSIALDSQGNVYVSGISWSASTYYDYATVKYDADGNEKWVQRYNGPGNNSDFQYGMALDREDNIYVTGGSGGVGTSADYATVKYDTDGNEKWVRRYNGPGNDDDYAYGIAVDREGNVYVTGLSSGLSTVDYTTIKYDPDGNEKWVRRYSGPGSGSAAHAIAVDGQGSAYVTGYSDGGDATQEDYATVKYDTDGNEKWVQRYNGPGNGNDYAEAVAVDGQGNVFVTGNSEGSGTGSDYATVKYHQTGEMGGALDLLLLD